MTTHNLFFYGTLVHPAILARVIGSDGAHLVTSDAILPDHTRHHVKGEDYPAVVTANEGKLVMGRNLTETEARVQGSLVRGLTEQDVALLDEFEGNEYKRVAVNVSLEAGAQAPAEVYVWTDPLSRLEQSLWTFQDFLRESAHRWVGQQGEERQEYKEVDRRRAMNGNITPTGVREIADKVKADYLNSHANGKQQVEEFGRSLARKYFNFERGWINLNHGSYGVAPKPVVDAVKRYQDSSNSAPDRFMRFEYMNDMNKLRSRLAEFVHCDKEDIVMVSNASMGVNSVMRSLTTTWQKGDKMLYYSTTIYEACSATLRMIVDSHPHLELGLVPVILKYPMTHAAVVEATKQAILDNERKGGGKIRLALVDAISSNPGVVVPWQELVKLYKQHDILSLVDAAHEIGQLPVNLRQSQPDFWISNCHKWLLAHRACAVLYVDKKHQHLIHSIPTGHYYRNRIKDEAMKDPDWSLEFEWNGTIDFAPLLATLDALDFRQTILGGEERITKYCHHLALKGGRMFAQILNTETMENTQPEEEGQLVANMINVRLPIDLPSTELEPQERAMQIAKIRTAFHAEQALHKSTMVPFFMHNDKPWTRLSAQVYIEFQDFIDVAHIVKEVCDKLNRQTLASGEQGSNGVR
ncbi:hypothetical protein OIO90_002523 [Microbotryomycetes sp. JL221]|nr:hypothetical protein OIO90_002523 [Microbotryomycetes sp. JL221]